MNPCCNKFMCRFDYERIQKNKFIYGAHKDENFRFVW